LSEVKAPSAPEVTDRASFLTEYLSTTDFPAVEASKGETAPEATEQPPEAPEGETEDTAAEAAEEQPEEAAEEAPEPAAAPTAQDEETDPQLAKRLEAIQRQERRAKEGLTREKAEFERQLQEWAPRIQAAEQFETLRSRARYDVVGVLSALGLTVDDFEPAAKSLFAHSPKAKENPALRETAERTMREREAFDRLSALENQNQQLLQRLEQQNIQRQTEEYLSSVTKAASDETPIVRTMLANDPYEAKDQLRQVALAILEETGETPDPADVVKELEKLERSRLKKRGIDFPTTKQSTPVAGEQRTATKTVSNQLTQSTTAARKNPQSRNEEITDVLAALESGRIDK
jgi:hypothetical protein